MPRPSNTAARRTQIVNGLLRVLATEGYAGATIRSIATAADVAPGLIHYHFRDKREILVELVESLVTYGQSRFAARAANARSAEDRVHAYIEARLAYGQDARTDAVAAWVMIGAEAVRDAEVREIYQEAMTKERALVRALLRAYLIERGKRVRKLDEWVAGVLAFIEGVFSLASNARELVPRGFAAKMATTWIERYADGETNSTKSES
jgi:TetR/AcrR family transcriptional regulator, transcriptional repressor of bet genes